MDNLKKYASYDQFKQELDQELKKTANSFVKIGYLLKMARDTDILSGKYQNVWEFAKTEYGLDKSQASRFMNINTKFSEGGYSDHLLGQYEGYGSSKLTLMLGLPDDIIDELTPDLSKQEIKGIAQDYKNEQAVTPIERMLEAEPVRPVFYNTLQEVIFEIGRDNPKMWVSISRACGGTVMQAVVDEVASIMAPDGERIFRCRVPKAGRKMLKVNENGVTIIDMRSTQKEQYTLQDLANAWVYIGADPTVNPYDSWEDIYESEFPDRPTPKPVVKDDFKVLQTETEKNDNDNPQREGKEQIQGKTEQKVQEGKKENPQKQKADIVSKSTGSAETERSAAGTDDKEPALHLEESEVEIVPEEEQIPGQMEVQDYPELMPDDSKIASAMNMPEDIPITLTNTAAVEELDKRDYLVAIRLQSDSLLEHLEAGKFKKAKDCLTTIQNLIRKLEAYER